MIASVIILLAFIATSNSVLEEYPMADLALRWTYFMMFAAAILAVGLPLINMLKDPKSMLRSLSGVGIVAVVILICYLMADSTPITLVGDKVIDDKATLLVSDTGLYATYAAFGIAIISIVAGEIYKVFKK